MKPPRDISRFVRMTYHGVYGIRWTFDIQRMIKAGWFAEELAGARKLSELLKRGKK